MLNLIPSDTFEIDPSEGTVTLIEPLDYDFGSKSYNLPVEAQDGGLPPLTSTVSLFINVSDVNDIAPEFIDPTPESCDLVVYEVGTQNTCTST